MSCPCEEAISAANREIHSLRRENENLREEMEILAWNLAGCDSYTMGYGLDSEPDRGKARPALLQVLQMAREYYILRRSAKNETLTREKK